MIKQFLQNFPDYYIQTFDDKGKDLSLLAHGKPKNFTSARLIELNKLGAGIYFTPNQFPNRRLQEQCAGINAWFIDMDYDKKEQWARLMECPLSPSIIVETRNSYHCYWLAKDGKIDNFDKIIRGLIKYFHADESCKDNSRVLRIPGFFHNKQEPYMVTIKFSDYDVKYTEDEMMKWYPYNEEETKTPLIPAIKNDGLDFWNIVARFNNRIMLQRLSGKPIANFESITFRNRSTGGEYIDVNGKPSDAWIDEHGLIGSGKGGGPTFIQWLAFYGWTKGEIAKWIKDECSDLLPSDILPISTVKIESMDLMASDIQMDELLSKKTNLTWGNKNLDENFSPLDHGRYVVLVGETGVGKTAWAFHFARGNAFLGNRVLYLSLEMSNEGLLARYARNMMGLSKKQWKERDFDKEKFKSYINGLPKTLILKKINSRDGVVNIEFIEKVLSEKYDMVFIDNFGFIESEGLDTNDKIKNISRAMVRLKNETNTTIVALHHFRKGGEKSSKIRNLDAILGSGKIGHDVDFAIQVFRDMDLDKDSFESEKAKLSIAMMKDRDFGELSIQNIYYKNGEFYSNYEDIQKT